jgi:hypothetical protein
MIGSESMREGIPGEFWCLERIFWLIKRLEPIEDDGGSGTAKSLVYIAKCGQLIPTCCETCIAQIL